NALGDCPSVQRRFLDRLQDEEVERSLEEIGARVGHWEGSAIPRHSTIYRRIVEWQGIACGGLRRAIGKLKRPNPGAGARSGTAIAELQSGCPGADLSYREGDS